MSKFFCTSQFSLILALGIKGSIKSWSSTLLGLSESPLLVMLSLVLNWLKSQESLWLSKKTTTNIKKNLPINFSVVNLGAGIFFPNSSSCIPVFVSLLPCFLVFCFLLTHCMFIILWFLFHMLSFSFFPMAPYPITLFPASSLLACFSALFPHFLPQPPLRNAETKVNLFY